ncbi:MAG: hypothetical protein F6J93_18365 [Oscillatoria sp. SIO1A7]|nr:hypothetical protein [Oscillatoria sp. SIO1A7]
MTYPLPDSFAEAIKNLVCLIDVQQQYPQATPPTSDAFTTALKLVIQAYEQTGYSFPYLYHAYTDDSGGITLTWSNQQNPNRQVDLFCPPSNEQVPKVSYSETIEYAIEDLSYDSTLADCFNEYNNYNES